MTTKPSAAPWADEPFPLIPAPLGRNELQAELHFSAHGATEMALAHNLIIRGLNAIVQQAPWVPDSISTSSSRPYRPQDVLDLLFFVRSWTKLVHHHHWVEESSMFPAFDELAGTPGLMDGSRNQHEAFHGGLARLQAYAETTAPAEYRWEGEGGMREIIDSFSGPLTKHLREEIGVILGFKEMGLDDAGLRKIWHDGEVLAKQNGNIEMMYDVFPLALGTSDKTYEGGNTFPPLPWFMPYLIKYWFAIGNGAWRFNPCDWWGHPKELAFGPGKMQ